jgi:hypothetical protein
LVRILASRGVDRHRGLEPQMYGVPVDTAGHQRLTQVCVLQMQLCLLQLSAEAGEWGAQLM